MKVRAKRLGFYKHKRRQVGSEFFLNSEKDFSQNWMEKLDKAPAKSSKAKPEPKKKAPSKDEEVI